MLKQLPNAITSANLLCGVVAILFIFQGDFVVASCLIFLAGVLDFFDGFTARLLKVGGEFGKQLDSLADCVTFGVTPALLLLRLSMDSNRLAGENQLAYLNYAALGIAVFSALRLAKFNLDTRQSDSFIGVPTPANSFLIASFPFLLQKFPGTMDSFLQQPLLVAGFAVLSCFLLVAELPLFSLKFKYFGWKGNEIRYVFLLLSLLVLALLQFAGIAFIIVLYIVLSIINNIAVKK